MIDGCNFHVTCLRDVERATAAINPSIIFSFVDPGTPISLNLYGQVKWFKYVLYDQEVGKHADEISKVVSCYLDDFRQFYQKGSSVLFHCHAGVSRSPAACYLALAMIIGDAKTAFEMMLRVCNKPWPNSRIIEDSVGCSGIPSNIAQPLYDYKRRNPNLLRYYRRLNSLRGLESPVKRVEG
jgi:predicted protein tyrosine phosphatase